MFSVFKMFYKMVQTQFNTTIKIVCSDNGGEYMSGSLKTFSRARHYSSNHVC